MIIYTYSHWWSSDLDPILAVTSSDQSAVVLWRWRPWHCCLSQLTREAANVSSFIQTNFICVQLLYSVLSLLSKWYISCVMQLSSVGCCLYMYWCAYQARNTLVYPSVMLVQLVTDSLVACVVKVHFNILQFLCRLSVPFEPCSVACCMWKKWF